MAGWCAEYFRRERGSSAKLNRADVWKLNLLHSQHTLVTTLESTSVSMTQTLTVEAWLDNIIIPLTPLLKLMCTSSDIPCRTLAVEAWLDNIIPRTPLLKPICPSSDVPCQYRHYGKRKRGLELEQPKSPELNQQQDLKLTHHPNKQPRIEPIPQRTRSKLRRAII